MHQVFVEQWSVCFTAAACPPAPDVAAKIHRDTYARITIFLRSLFTTLRALPAHQVGVHRRLRMRHCTSFTSVGG
jgi:hypothetical protein